jgi:hypothetical protein
MTTASTFVPSALTAIPPGALFVTGWPVIIGVVPSILSLFLT